MEHVSDSWFTHSLILQAIVHEKSTIEQVRRHVEAFSHLQLFHGCINMCRNLSLDLLCSLFLSLTSAFQQIKEEPLKDRETPFWEVGKDGQHWTSMVSNSTKYLSTKHLNLKCWTPRKGKKQHSFPLLDGLNTWCTPWAITAIGYLCLLVVPNCGYNPEQGHELGLRVNKFNRSCKWSQFENMGCPCKSHVNVSTLHTKKIHRKQWTRCSLRA